MMASRPEVYTPPTKPWDHQKRALDKMDGREAFALFMAMRTGKTKTALDDYGRMELRGDVKNLSVIAPGGVYRTWEKACVGDPETGDVGHLSTDLKSRVLLHTWESGAGVGARKVLDRFMAERERPRILLMNCEALSSVKLAREVAVEFHKADKVVSIIDESTIIKNPSSKRTKFINRDIAQEADFRRILSGLPTPKSPLDYYSQFEFLDWRILGFRSYFAFRARYAIMWAQNIGGRSIQIVKGYQNLDDLAKRVEPASFRVRLEDCYDVPPKMYLFRYVELTPEQKRIYTEFKNFATARLDEDSHVTATVVIAQITRLSQILCGHTVDENGVEHDIPENRTQGVLDILEEYDGKAIIWCAYTQDVDRVAAALRKEYGDDAVSVFYGGNKNTRDEFEEKPFLNDPARRFMVATASAGGRGRTWTIANLHIYHSNTEDLEHREQSEERGSGVGKDDRVTVVDLCVKGTVDEKKIKSLRAKIDLTTAVNGEGYRAWLI
jgi:SNF2 family DNA or RNA helicase